MFFESAREQAEREWKINNKDSMVRRPLPPPCRRIPRFWGVVLLVCTDSHPQHLCLVGITGNHLAFRCCWLPLTIVSTRLPICRRL